MAEQQMPNPIEMVEVAAQGFRSALEGVKAEQMSSPTPCSLWSVQQLINHNIKVSGFVQGILEGNVTVNPMEVDGSLPAEGAVEALAANVAGVLELAKAPGLLQKTLETPFGPMVGGEFLMIPVTDMLIHTWDLAKATGQNTAIDGSLVNILYPGLVQQMPQMRGMEQGGQAFFGPEVMVSADASLQDKLIGLMGRQP